MNLLKAKGLHKRLNNNYIYKDISLTIRKGECYVLAGADGEGKTSILHTILGLSNYEQGKIKIYDKTTEPQATYSIGYVPDELLCFPHMTGAELLDMTIKLDKLSDALDYATELIEYFDINPALSLMDMCDDMNKCTYIVSTLLSKPDFLILDEPFNFLEEESTAKLKAFIKKYRKAGNTILITHENYGDVADIATRFSILKDKAQIKTDEAPKNYITQKYITFTSQANNFDRFIFSKGKTDTTMASFFKPIAEDDNKLSFLFQGGSNTLRKILANADYTDITIKDISVDDQVFLKYDWMEGA